ncbi:hypothetical protein YPPY48_0220, partial [Yersinia pestis PY-48]
MIKRTCRR